MTIKRLDHISVVVDDLAAAIAFFAALGMTLEGEMPVEGSCLPSKASTTRSLACAPKAPNSSARWPSTHPARVGSGPWTSQSWRLWSRVRLP
jgi:catechol 2,3-dioxygenase-like lactoylglutathione lyase family enzyme